jgi:hypothetical protein
MPTGTRPAPPVGTVRLTLSGTLATHKWANVLWLLLTSASPASADLNTLLTAINTAWGTRVRPLLGTDCSLTLMQGVWLHAAGSEIVGTNATVQTGGVGEASVNSAAACFIISNHISSYYRGGHPRTYLPGVRASAVTNGSAISGSVLTSLTTGWNNLRTDINALTAGGITAVQLGTVRFQSGNAWLTPPVFRAFINSTVRSTLGTQRRRILA